MNLEKCAPSGITCEGIENPIGITVRSPRFSWIFNQNGNNRYQKAYRIVVAKDSESGEIVWDSGKVTSGETRFILYQGKPLQSGTRYWFTIQLWDREDREGIKSSPSYFETALFNDALWKAEWIAGDSLLRKEFSISSDKTEARLYASGLGYRKIWINGFPVGDDELAPSYTDYEEMTEYRLYRVENLLQSGKNTVAIMLGNSFYSGIQCAILQLEIKDGKGTINRIISDNTWRCAPGPIIENSIYDGEVFDARKEPEGWRFPGFDDSLWKKVQTVPSPAKRLVSALLPPIQITDTLSPIRITRLDRNTQVADFGKNIAGWAVLAMNAASGDKVTLRYAELQDPRGYVDQANLRKAKARDIYIAKGNGKETYRPSFTYHGFRYVQIEGYPGDLMPENIRAEIVRTAVRDTGFFSCSDGLLNSVYNAMKLTLSNNMHSIPTDCCQRDERKGWMGDGYACAEANIFNFDMYAFYIKWLDDIKQSQDPDSGAFIYPQAPPWTKTESITWAAAFFLIPRYLYEYYADIKPIIESFPLLEKYFQYLENREEQGLLLMDDPYGDWLAIQRTPFPQVTNGCYYWFALNMEFFAGLLGNRRKEKAYREKKEQIKEAYNRKFYHPETGYYGQYHNISQFGNMFPLYLGMVPEGERKKVLHNLLQDIQEARGEPTLPTGFLGTKYGIILLNSLGYKNLVYRLFRKKSFPSWGFMIDHGATTIWERWEYFRGPEMNSHCHPPFAAPVTWFYRGLGGIGFGEDQDGIRTFTAEPFFPEELNALETSLDTPWGTHGLTWKRRGDSAFDLSITVPGNTRCYLLIPRVCDLRLRQEAIKMQRLGEKKRVILGSGKYSFTISLQK